MRIFTPHLYAFNKVQLQFSKQHDSIGKKKKNTQEIVAHMALLCLASSKRLCVQEKTLGNYIKYLIYCILLYAVGNVKRIDLFDKNRSISSYTTYIHIIIYSMFFFFFLSYYLILSSNRARSTEKFH